MVERHGFREYYNPLTGEGLAARRFGWSTLLVDLLPAPSDGPPITDEVDHEPHHGNVLEEALAMGREALSEVRGRRWPGLPRLPPR